MQAANRSLYVLIFVVLILSSAAFTIRQKRLDQARLDNARPPWPVTYLGLAPNRPTQTLTWRLPLNKDLAKLDRPLHFFMAPVIVGLNYGFIVEKFDRVAMLGISGGGWTTHLQQPLTREFRPLMQLRAVILRIFASRFHPTAVILNSTARRLGTNFISRDFYSYRRRPGLCPVLQLL